MKALPIIAYNSNCIQIFLQSVIFVSKLLQSYGNSSAVNRQYCNKFNLQIKQVEHPKPAVGEKADEFNRTRLRYGPIGSSKFIARNAQTRLEFGQSNGIVAYDK